MKLGNIVILAAVAIVAYLIFGGKGNGPNDAEAQKSEEYAKLADRPRFHVKGKIIQHAENGRLLISGQVGVLGDSFAEDTLCSVVSYKNPGTIADGETIDVQAWCVDTYKYTDAQGAARTVDDYLECPSAIDPSANPVDNRPASQGPATPIPIVSKAQLVAVRGTVVRSTSDGALVLNCHHPHPGGVSSDAANPLDAGGTRFARNVAAQRESIIARDRERFGDLLIFQAGQWKRSNWSLPELEGWILLKGHPNAAFLAHGEKLNVVAVQLPEIYQQMHVAAAQFNLQ